MADMEEDSDKAQEWGQSPPLARVIPPSRSCETHSMIINMPSELPKKDNYIKITNYLILHIRKTYKNGRDIANAIENQEHFNFDSSPPKLKILTTVKTVDTFSEEKLEINMISTRLSMKENYNCISSEKVIIAPTWGKHMHSYLGNAQQAYSIE